MVRITILVRFSSPTMSHIKRRDTGSSPVVGSVAEQKGSNNYNSSSNNGSNSNSNNNNNNNNNKGGSDAMMSPVYIHDSNKETVV